MKKRVVLMLLMLVCLNIIALTAILKNDTITKDRNAVTAGKARGVAVLELFTSEGCSSCPPADELVAKIQNEYKDQPVYLLAYHVDYWDRLGWKDKFSNHDFTERQSMYANLFHLNSIYTPQIVINGNAEMVGSDESKVRSGINDALSNENKTELIIHAKPGDNLLTVDYAITGPVQHNQLLFEVVQKSATTNVQRGENKGRMLSHVQVVYSLKSFLINKNGKGNAVIPLPPAFNKSEWEIIALVQDSDDGKISAAAQVTL